MPEKTEPRSYDDVFDEIVELPDRDGLLVPADAAARPGQVMTIFRRYAREQWGWPDDITNAGIDGPHQYVLFPAYVASPDEFRRAAVDLLEGETLLGDRDTAVDRIAEQLASDASTIGGWRRTTFAPPDMPTEKFWKVKVGYVG